MIKVGIAGADTQLGGELLRLLIHHPEVELKVLYAPEKRGINVSSFHKGLVGETELRFSDSFNLEEIDLLFFITGPLPNNSAFPEDLRIVIFQNSDKRMLDSMFDYGDFSTGLSEMFRKPLVRGARAAYVLLPPVSVSLIALYPLASHLLLNDMLDVKIYLPTILKGKFSKENIEEDIEKHLRQVQLSFKKIHNLELHDSNTERSIIVDIEFPCNITESEIEKIYNDIYDDHNFTFIIRKEPDPLDVAGTQKCLLYISKPSEDKLKIRAVADGILRGGAGDGIHVMNLLFGLFEKTGLNLQASFAFKSKFEQ